MKRTRTVIYLAVICLSFVVCAHANSQEIGKELGARDDRQVIAMQDLGSTSPDEQLNRKIRRKSDLWNSFKDVSLNTKDGTVTLEGTVNSESDQQKIMTEIQTIEGVKSVQSNLKIIGSKTSS
jgi:osmotically-inducible protein OsmY